MLFLVRKSGFNAYITHNYSQNVFVISCRVDPRAVQSIFKLREIATIVFLCFTVLEFAA